MTRIFNTKTLFAATFLIANFCMRGADAAVVCSVSGGAVSFGVYNPLNALPLDSTASIALSCSLTRPDNVVVAYSISLSQGSGSYSQRTMVGGAAILNYNLFLDGTHTQVWGDGSAGTFVINGSMGLGHGLGNNGSQTDTYTNYARMSAGQDVVPGTYNDLITITVTW